MKHRYTALTVICPVALAATMAWAGNETAPGAMADNASGMKHETMDIAAQVAELEARVSSNPGDACLRNELGIALARGAFFDEATDAFRASLDIHEDPVVYNNLGSLYLRTGRRSKAMSAFRKALSLDPNYALAWYNLGSAYDSARKFKGAVRSYRRALELDPTLADPAKNPQVVNNHYLIAVATERYIDTAGSQSLPMQSSCGQSSGK